MDHALITSMQNPKVRQLLALQQKSSARREAGLFVVEGRRELEHCVEAGYEVDSTYCCPSIAVSDPSLLAPRAAHYEVSEAVYGKIAYRGGTEGVMALVRPRHTTLRDIDTGGDPLIVVLESVEKPGNLGAILRSADASGTDAVIVCDPLTDLYNPNLIRSSVGALFSVPCVACTTAECIRWLKDNGLQILTAQLQDSRPYYDTPMTRGTALEMGTEATGLTDAWRQAADAHIRIPMLGRLDSLNVSVSAAILMFEAVRQRHKR